MNEEVLKTLLTPEQLEALETIANRFNTKIDGGSNERMD